MKRAAQHPAWWIEQLEHLEAIDEPGGVAYGNGTTLRPAVIHSLRRRGLVSTRIQPVDVQGARGKPQRLCFPWAELTDRGRDVFERDLPPALTL